MRWKKLPWLVCSLLVIGSIHGFAGGGGGMTYGMHFQVPTLANYNLRAMYFGGYGYGTGSGGSRIGGFGCAILSNSDTLEFNGGFGGIITGKEFSRSGPVRLAVNLWLGLGGAGTNFGDPEGFFGLFMEGNFEIGFNILPWMQLTPYLGYQLIANLIPGLPVVGTLTYTPVFGLRLVWGNFN